MKGYDVAIGREASKVREEAVRRMKIRKARTVPKLREYSKEGWILIWEIKAAFERGYEVLSKALGRGKPTPGRRPESSEPRSGLAIAQWVIAIQHGQGIATLIGTGETLQAAALMRCMFESIIRGFAIANDKTPGQKGERRRAEGCYAETRDAMRTGNEPDWVAALPEPDKKVVGRIRYELGRKTEEEKLVMKNLHELTHGGRQAVRAVLRRQEIGCDALNEKQAIHAGVVAADKMHLVVARIIVELFGTEATRGRELLGEVEEHRQEWRRASEQHYPIEEEAKENSGTGE